MKNIIFGVVVAFALSMPLAATLKAKDACDDYNYYIQGYGQDLSENTRYRDQYVDYLNGRLSNGTIVIGDDEWHMYVDLISNFESSIQQDIVWIEFWDSVKRTEGCPPA